MNKNNLLEFIYPENISCVSCNQPIPEKNPYSLCKNCYEEMKSIKLSNYEYDRVVLKLKEKNKNIDRIFLLFKYNGIIKKMIHSYKYHQASYLSKILAEIISDFIEKEQIAADYIQGVPVHKSRLDERGYDHIKLITGYVSKETKIPVISLVKRVKPAMDSYNMSEKQRHEALSGAFIANYDERISEKRVLIIDDLLTSGATMENICLEYKRVNPKSKMDILIMARPENK